MPGEGNNVIFLTPSSTLLLHPLPGKNPWRAGKDKLDISHEDVKRWPHFSFLQRIFSWNPDYGACAEIIPNVTQHDVCTSQGYLYSDTISGIPGVFTHKIPAPGSSITSTSPSVGNR